MCRFKEAREGRNDARKLLDQGLDPSHQKKIRKSLKALQADENFQAIATEWLEKKKVDCVESTYNGIEAIPKEIGALLRCIDEYSGDFKTRYPTPAGNRVDCAPWRGVKIRI